MHSWDREDVHQDIRHVLFSRCSGTMLVPGRRVLEEFRFVTIASVSGLSARCIASDLPDCAIIRQIDSWRGLIATIHTRHKRFTIAGKGRSRPDRLVAHCQKEEVSP